MGACVGVGACKNTVPTWQCGLSGEPHNATWPDSVSSGATSHNTPSYSYRTLAPIRPPNRNPEAAVVLWRPLHRHGKGSVRRRFGKIPPPPPPPGQCLMLWSGFHGMVDKIRWLVAWRLLTAMCYIRALGHSKAA